MSTRFTARPRPPRPGHSPVRRPDAQPAGAEGEPAHGGHQVSGQVHAQFIGSCCIAHACVARSQRSTPSGWCRALQCTRRCAAHRSAGLHSRPAQGWRPSRRAVRQLGQRADLLQTHRQSAPSAGRPPRQWRRRAADGWRLRAWTAGAARPQTADLSRPGPAVQQRSWGFRWRQCVRTGVCGSCSDLRPGPSPAVRAAGAAEHLSECTTAIGTPSYAAVTRVQGAPTQEAATGPQCEATQRRQSMHVDAVHRQRAALDAEEAALAASHAGACPGAGASACCTDTCPSSVFTPLSLIACCATCACSWDTSTTRVDICASQRTDCVSSSAVSAVCSRASKWFVSLCSRPSCLTAPQ